MSEKIGPYEVGMVHHADCLDAMRQMPDGCCDAIITDPPYSRAGAVSNGRRGPGGKVADAIQSDQFWLHWFASVAEQLVRVTKPEAHAFVFCDYRTIPLVERGLSRDGWGVTQCLVWDRESIGMGSPFRASYELIAFARGPLFVWEGNRGLPNVKHFRWPYGEHEHHAAEKPVGLLRWLIEQTTKPDAIIADPFSGSGSVVIACNESGRRCVAFEIDEAQAERANARIAATGERLGEVRPDTANAGQQIGLAVEGEAT